MITSQWGLGQGSGGAKERVTVCSTAQLLYIDLNVYNIHQTLRPMRLYGFILVSLHIPL